MFYFQLNYSAANRHIEELSIVREAKLEYTRKTNSSGQVQRTLYGHRFYIFFCCSQNVDTKPGQMHYLHTCVFDFVVSVRSQLRFPRLIWSAQNGDAQRLRHIAYMQGSVR